MNTLFYEFSYFREVLVVSDTESINTAGAIIFTNLSTTRCELKDTKQASHLISTAWYNANNTVQSFPPLNATDISSNLYW